MTTAATSAMRRRNLFHAAVWLAIACVGLVALAQLRRTGQRIVVEYDGSNAVQAAWALYYAGNTAEAQKAMYRLLRTRPELDTRALEVFGPHLMAMPRVLSLLASDRADATETQRLLARALTGRAWPDSATHTSTAEVALWRAQDAFRSGDIATANTAFDLYWQNTGGRAARADDIAAAYPNEEERLNALLWCGLWQEAFALARQADETAASPTARVALAIDAELDGDTTTARRLFESVLADRPTNLLALLGRARCATSNSARESS